MNKKFRLVALLAVLALALIVNVAVSSDAYAAAYPAESDTPCTDQYNGCMAGGGGESFCNGMWCGCMYNRYGYVCSAS